MNTPTFTLLKASSAGVLVLALAFLSPTASAQKEFEPVKASLVDWNGAEGTHTVPPHENAMLPETSIIAGYDLLAQDIINPEQNGGQHSLDFKNLIFQWLDRHPNAIVTPVATSGPDEVRKQMGLPPITWAWVTDGSESLNEYLVQHGACPSQAMNVFIKPAFEGYLGAKRPNLMIPRAAYQRFRANILADEASAKQQKLGLWSPNGTTQTEILPVRGEGDRFETKLGSAFLTPSTAMYRVDRAKIGLAPLPPGARCTLSLNGPKDRQSQKEDATVEIDGEPTIRILFLQRQGHFGWLGESDVYSDPRNPSAYTGLDYETVSLPNSLGMPKTLTIEYVGSDKRLSSKPNLTLADVKPMLARWAAQWRRKP